MGSSAWATPGGDVGEEAGSANATNVAGSRVTVNVTDLVQTDLERGLRLALHAVCARRYRQRHQGELPGVLLLGGQQRQPPADPDDCPRFGSGAAASSDRRQHAQGDAVEHRSRATAQDGRSNIDRVVDFIVEQEAGHHLVQRDHALFEQQPAADDRRQAARPDRSDVDVQVGPEVRGVERRRRVRHDPPRRRRDRRVPAERRPVGGDDSRERERTHHQRLFHPSWTTSRARRASHRSGSSSSWTDNHSEQRIVAGDFNGWPGTSEINEMLRTHKDGWAVARSKGAAVLLLGQPGRQHAEHAHRLRVVLEGRHRSGRDASRRVRHEN